MDILHNQNLEKSMTGILRHGYWMQLIVPRRRRITFVDKDGDEHTFDVADGDNLLDIAQSEELEMEGVWILC